MEGEGKTYTIYRITSPSGKQYVRYTSMSIAERWRRHLARASAGEAVGHPFYDEIRSYPADEFKAEKIARTNQRMEAMRLEQKLIAGIPKCGSMNISSGGSNDAREGGLIFWERLNTDPQRRKEFLKKLSETKKANDWSDYGAMAEKSAQWRKEHPREAYKMSYRAIRIANKSNGFPPPSCCPEDTRPLKERLMHKYRLNEIKRQNTTRAWNQYSDEKRAEISRKISESMKERCKSKSQEEIDAACANARAHIDREKQGSAARQGLSKWWDDLKAHPERYKEYMQRRTASLQKTLEKKVVKE